MKIIQVLVVITAMSLLVKQVLLLLNQQIDKCDELPEIEEEEM